MIFMGRTFNDFLIIVLIYTSLERNATVDCLNVTIFRNSTHLSNWVFSFNCGYKTHSSVGGEDLDGGCSVVVSTSSGGVFSNE